MTADIYTTERPYYRKGKHVLNGEKSETLLFNRNYSQVDMPWFIKAPDVSSALFCIFLLPVYIFVDAYRFLLAIIWPFFLFAQRVSFWLRPRFEQQTAVLDLHRISWTLRGSIGGPGHLSALNHLATITLACFDSTLVADCLDILIGCVNVTNGRVTITQGSEQLAMLSALCCLHTLSHLTAIDPRIEDIRHRYTTAFPPNTSFDNLPFSHTLGAIHSVFYQPHRLHMVFPIHMDRITLITWRVQQVQWVQWKDYTPSSNEHIIVAHALTRLTWFEYKRRGYKVPRWLLRFAFHSLSQDPLPPTPVVVDCLSIIATDLGCFASNTTILDRRCVYIWKKLTFLTNN